MHTAKGHFDINLTPASAEGETIDRMAIAKTFHGDLEGTSTGMMLAVRTETEGSAGYVAIEKFDGTLAGRKGSFSLQHNGIMDRGKPSLTVAVIPDSGTGELTAIVGTMTIDIQLDGTHNYSFDYRLP